MKASVTRYVRIDHAQLVEMTLHAEGTSEECCGFLLGHEGRSIVTCTIPTTNVARDPGEYFVIDPLAYLRAEQYAATSNLELIGIYHSHPNSAAIPSETDRTNALQNLSYVILSLDDQQCTGIRSWRLNSSEHFEEELIIS